MDKQITKSAMKRITIIVFIITLFTAASSMADHLYVNSRKAPIWEAPTFKAAKTGILMKANKVAVLEKKGGWYRVRHNNRIGWMLKLMLTCQPPLDSGAVVSQQAIETMSERARRRPSSYASTAAARGLKDKRRRFSEKLKLNYGALEHMESFRVDDQQALEFLKVVQKDD